MNFGKLQGDHAVDGAKRLKELRGLKSDLLRHKNAYYLLQSNIDQKTSTKLDSPNEQCELIALGKLDLRQDIEKKCEFSLGQMDRLIAKFNELKNIGEEKKRAN